MGWWGYDVMEGDTPLDCQGDIIDMLADPALLAKRDSDEGDWMKAMDDAENSAYEALKTIDNVLNVLHAIQSGEMCSYDPDIALQVLGEMVMVSGGAINDEVRAACIQGAASEIELDEGGWKEEGARVDCLKAFVARLQQYDGTPTEPTSKGLFATIGEALSEGHEGLINV